MSDLSSYLSNIGNDKLKQVEVAKVIIFINMRITGGEEVAFNKVVRDFEDSGLSRPNTSRLYNTLCTERGVTRGRNPNSLRLTEAALIKYETQYPDLVKKKVVTRSDSVIPLEIIESTRDYIEKIAKQINACYDGCCYDASLVMMRKLFEVCLIEAFENKGKKSLILDKDGNYLQLSGIIKKALDQNPLNLTRNSKEFLKERKAKKRGDLAAHNPKFVAIQKDIEEIKDDFRVVVQELISIAGFK